MLGKIENYNPDTETGVIKSEENFFTFHLDDWKASVPPDQGDDVNFDAHETTASNIDLVGAYLTKPKAVKYKYVAVFLALLFGGAGLHRLYLGYYKIALAQLLITLVTAGYGLLWGFVESVLLFADHINKDAKGRPLK